MRRLSTLFLVCFLAVLAGLSGVVPGRSSAAGRRRRPAACPASRVPDQGRPHQRDPRGQPPLDAQRRPGRGLRPEGHHRDAEGRGPGVLRGRGLDRHERRGNPGQQPAERQPQGERGDPLQRRPRDADGHRWTGATSSAPSPPTTPWRSAARAPRSPEWGSTVRMQEETAASGRNVRVVINDRAKSNLSLFPRSKS